MESMSEASRGAFTCVFLSCLCTEVGQTDTDTEISLHPALFYLFITPSTLLLLLLLLGLLLLQLFISANKDAAADFFIL